MAPLPNARGFGPGNVSTVPESVMFGGFDTGSDEDEPFVVDKDGNQHFKMDAGKLCTLKYLLETADRRSTM